MNPLFKRVVDMIPAVKQGDPELWKACCPRRFVPPNGYANPQLYSMAMACSVALARKWTADRHEHKAGDSNLIMIAMQALKYGVPTYFIGEDFVRAVAATTPPANTPLSVVKFPMESMTFVLPLEFSKECFGIPVPFITIVHMPVGTVRLIDQKGKELSKGYFVNDTDRIMIHGQAWWGEVPVDYMHCSPTTSDIERVVGQFDFVTYTGAAGSQCELNGVKIAEPTREQENAVARKINNVAIKLLMAIAARPELREVGSCQRPAAKCHGGKEELWSPNMIGRLYKIVREPGYKPEGTHLSPRMHWRRGHMRNQRYGPVIDKETKLPSLTKLIWIDPVLVCSEAEEK